jgi:phosphopantothenoylcysteine decarboxylase/phosphopantothenate--cysteine ligase
MLVLHAETTAEMGEVVRAAVLGADALVMAAAVADFRPRTQATSKLTRDEGLIVELEPTEDILAGIGATVAALPAGAPRPYLVGFAAETGSMDRAVAKLRRKGVDLLVANDVAEEGSGFGTDTNHVWILDADGGQVDLSLRSKRAVAEEILDRVARALDGRAAAAQTDRVTQETRS